MVVLSGMVVLGGVKYGLRLLGGLVWPMSRFLRSLTAGLSELGG